MTSLLGFAGSTIVSSDRSISSEDQSPQWKILQFLREHGHNHRLYPDLVLLPDLTFMVLNHPLVWDVELLNPIPLSRIFLLFLPLESVWVK